MTEGLPEKQTPRKAYRIVGGLAGFLVGFLVFMNFHAIWYGLGKLEVFGFWAAVVIIIMILFPLSPFIGIWLGLFIGGKIYDRVYPVTIQKD